MEIYTKNNLIIFKESVDNKTYIVEKESNENNFENLYNQALEQIAKMLESEKRAEILLNLSVPSEEVPHILTIAKWIREHRNKLLAESDWTQMPDSPLDNETKKQWQNYRKALRDLPKEWGLPSIGKMAINEKSLKIDLSQVKVKEDIEKLPFPTKPSS
jgi:hypothetical protein